MTGEDEPRLRAALRLEGRIGDRPSTDEIGPAVPAARFDHIESVGRIADRTRSAIIRALIGRQQAAVGQEAEAVGVAQPPCHQRKFRAVRTTAQHRGRARHLAGERRAQRAGVAERREGRGRRALSGLEWIDGIEHLARQCDIEPRQVARVRQLLEPGQIVGVEPDHARIRHRPLAEVKPAIGPDRHHVEVIVAAARHAVENGVPLAPGRPAADAAGKTTFRNSRSRHRARRDRSPARAIPRVRMSMIRPVRSARCVHRAARRRMAGRSRRHTAYRRPRTRRWSESPGPRPAARSPADGPPGFRSRRRPAR